MYFTSTQGSGTMMNKGIERLKETEHKEDQRNTILRTWQGLCTHELPAGESVYI